MQAASRAGASSPCPNLGVGVKQQAVAWGRDVGCEAAAPEAGQLPSPLKAQA